MDGDNVEEDGVVIEEINDEEAVSSADPEGGTGVPDPLETYKNIEFLSTTGPDPLKITNQPIQHSMLGHLRPASETPKITKI